MNIDELLKLPMGEPTIGGAPPTPLTVVDRKEAKKLQMYNRIVLVDRFVEPAVQKIQNLQSLSRSGMKDENVLAISGIATLEVMKNATQEATLTKYLYMLPMGFSYKTLDQIVLAQMLFIVVFQQMYYMAVLADLPDIPRFTESFEKRYTKIRELLKKEETATMIFSIPADQIHTRFWKTVNDSLTIDHEFTFYEILNLILEKEPKELDAYFNGLINPPAPEPINNDMSVARRSPEKPATPVASAQRPSPPPPPQSSRDPGTILSRSRNEPTNNSNSLSTATVANNNEPQALIEGPRNRPLNQTVIKIIKEILFGNTNFYENYILGKHKPVAGNIKVLLETLINYEKDYKESYNTAIKEYTELTGKARGPRRGGRYTLKNYRKINYAY